MRDAVLALLASRAILERVVHHFTPSSNAAHHAEQALAHLTACIAFTRATSLRGIRAKARLLSTYLAHGTQERALVVSLTRDIDGLSRPADTPPPISNLT